MRADSFTQLIANSSSINTPDTNTQNKKHTRDINSIRYSVFTDAQLMMVFLSCEEQAEVMIYDSGAQKQS